MSELSKIEVLFVDDEENVLHALQRTMRSKHQEWAIRFAPSGLEALRMLQERPADVIVSDMRMPGMDGATLLHKVRSLYPLSIRFVLSGHADDIATMRALGAVHRYLSKPCDKDRLVCAIEDAVALRDAVVSEANLKLLMSAGDLSVPGGAFARLQQVLADEMASVADIVSAIRLSEGLVVRVIQAANSPIVGAPQSVTGLEQAVRLLGVVILKALALQDCVLGQIKPQVAEALEPFDLSGYANAACERVAALAERAGLTQAEREEAMTASLLHLIGIAAFCAAAPEAFVLMALTNAKGGPRGLELAIERATGISPQRLGGSLLQLWSMPSELTAGVLVAYEPRLSPRAPNRRDAVVHLACVSTALKAQRNEPAPETHLDIDYLQAALGPGNAALWSGYETTSQTHDRRKGAA